MSGVVFMNTLRRNWRQILYWGGGLAVLGWWMLLIIRDANILKQYSELFNNLPPAMMNMFGVDSADLIATPEGFIGFGYGTYSVLIMVIFGIVAGLNVSANEEEEGIMDILLSLPLARWRVIAEKSAAYALLTIIITLLGFGGLLFGRIGNSLELDMGKVFQMSIIAIPAALMVMTFTAFVATIVRRGTAIAIATVFVTASFFMNFIAEAVTSKVGDVMGALSFFTYADSQAVLSQGLKAANIALLLGIGVILFAGSIWGFEHRDIGI
jgi:ABC-2 type transport system permease protein